LTRPHSAEIDAASQGGALAAGVGRRPDVVIGGSRGVHLDIKTRPLLRRQVPQHAFRRRTSADITQTNEENAN